MIKRRNNRVRHKINDRLIVAFLSIVVILIFSVGIQTSSILEKEKVIKTYCSDFGLYGQQLTLKKGDKFSYWYAGCSQTSGAIKGRFEIKDSVLILQIDKSDLSIPLSARYQIVKNQLFPLNEGFDAFVDCKDYVGPWMRIESIEK